MLLVLHRCAIDKLLRAYKEKGGGHSHQLFIYNILPWIPTIRMHLVKTLLENSVGKKIVKKKSTTFY